MDAKKFGTFIATLRKENNMTQVELAQKLQELRKQKNLTQEELSEILFVSRTAISKWESGVSHS